MQINNNQNGMCKLFEARLSHQHNETIHHKSCISDGLNVATILQFVIAELTLYKSLVRARVSYLMRYV